ncbi:MAG: hypothetical protein ABEJ65_12980 [bacterium]
MNNEIKRWKSLLMGVLLGIFVVIISTPVHAITSRSVYWGTAARGMAGAYTAAGGDFAGISYNPANSSSIHSGQFVSDFNQLTQNSVNVRNGALGGAMRIGSWVHGIALNRTNLEFDFNNFGVTSGGLNLEYNDDVYYYNSAWNITPNSHLAANVKYYSLKTDVQDGGASGYGVDLGYMYFLGDRATLGLSLKNLIAKKNWESGTSEDLPLEARGGVRYRPISDLALEMDLVYGENPGLKSVNMGGEWWVWKKFQQPDRSLRTPYFRYMQRQTADRIKFGLALRSGVEVETAGSENTNISMGLGMQFGGGKLDYAFQQQSNFENQHFFGFSSSFGGSEQDYIVSQPWSSSTYEEGKGQTSKNKKPSPESIRQQPPGQSQAQRRPARRQRYGPPTSGRSSFAPDRLKVGLLQWQLDPGIDFAAEQLERRMASQSGLKLTVYEQNPGVEKSIINDQLTSSQQASLVEKTGKSVLITGEIRRSSGYYGATAYVVSENQRKEIQVYSEEFSAMLNQISSRVQEAIKKLKEKQAQQPKKYRNRRRLPVPNSIRVGLLQWEVDPNVKFGPSTIEKKISDLPVQSTVYDKNRTLQKSVILNALSKEEYKALLKKTKQDYLITGKIVKLRTGYVGKAFLIKDGKRVPIKVIEDNYQTLVDKITRKIEDKLAS